MLAFSNDYYGLIFRATQSVELFCTYFSTFKILKNCCKIRKKTLTVWKFQTIKVILYSNLQIML